MKLNFDLIGYLENVFSKLPPLPQEAKDFLVRILPVVTVVFGILITLASIMDFMGSAFISSFTLGGGGPELVAQLMIRSSLGIAQGVFMIFAFTHLKAKLIRGWRLLFWSQILWIVASILSFSISLLLGIAALYLIYQVKSYYK